MSFKIAALLTQDGLVTSAVYALVALALVMVFSITRIIFIPQGEIITLSALTLATLHHNVLPGTLWVTIIGGIIASIMELATWIRHDHSRSRLLLAIFWFVYPILISGVAYLTIGKGLGPIWNFILMLLLVVPISPITYRIAFRPLGDASVLVLMFVAIAVHFILMGLALIIFGAEGMRNPSLIPGGFKLAGVNISFQAMLVIAVTILIIVVMVIFFGRTLKGKALRATAFNRIGARLVGIETESAARLAFFLSGIIGSMAGALIVSITMISYNSGFEIGLKGLIAAIFAGLVSYPMAAIGAIIVGLSESFFAFYASGYKYVIVFALVIPVLLWRSFRTVHIEEDEE